jgi:hypothetical protein
LLEHIGLKPLRELTARDVRRGLEALSGKVSTRYLQMARAALARAIRYAKAHDLIGRNVATPVDNPAEQIGRPSRSFTLEQSLALLEAAQKSRLNAYVVLSLAVGIRTEEAITTGAEVMNRILNLRSWIVLARPATQTPRRSC